MKLLSLYRFRAMDKKGETIKHGYAAAEGENDARDLIEEYLSTRFALVPAALSVVETNNAGHRLASENPLRIIVR